MYIERTITAYVEKLAKMFPVVMVAGPRQSGKSTLVKQMFANGEYLTMDDLSVLSMAKSDPVGFLKGKHGIVIIDEVQKAPELFDAIKMEADRSSSAGRFILTGSNQPELFEKVSESLAGRIGIAELLPLSCAELKGAGVDVSVRDETLFRGFMPRLFSSDVTPGELYANYFRTYVERDARKIVNVGDLDLFETFVQLLAGRVGQLFNRHSLANDVGVSEKTVTRWLSVLRTSYVVFTLRPYHNNFGKRITKSPKVYFTEPGLAVHLLGIRSPADLATHPLMGNLFENMVVADALKSRLNAGARPGLYFYRNGAGTVEVDLLSEDGTGLCAHEIKASSTFSEKMARGMRAFAALAPNVRRSTVIYSGATHLPLAANYADMDALA